jgi:hypothetical protein
MYFFVETIGPKTVSALLRQNATIEPVDTSRGVGKHLVSLLTTASKETASMKNGMNFFSLFFYKFYFFKQDINNHLVM